jgi:hypothetical protein
VSRPPGGPGVVRRGMEYPGLAPVRSGERSGGYLLVECVGYSMCAEAKAPARAPETTRFADRQFDRAFAYAQTHPIGEERFLRMAQGTEPIPDEPPRRVVASGRIY